MKPFQQYIADLNHVYEYRVKIAGVDPKGEVMERINMLDDVSACYSIARKDPEGNYSDNEKDNVYVSCHDGFEQYWQASNDIGY